MSKQIIKEAIKLRRALDKFISSSGRRSVLSGNLPRRLKSPEDLPKADSDSVDPHAADPDSADPDSADPDSADPDSADPDSADSKPSSKRGRGRRKS